jgi:hypothetical protein
MEDNNLKNLQNFFDKHKSLTITNLNLPVPYITTKDVLKSRPAFRYLGKLYNKYTPLGVLDRMEKREKKKKGTGGLLKGAREFKEKKEYEIAKDKMKLEKINEEPERKDGLETLKKGVVGKFIESTPIGQFFGTAKGALEELGFSFDKEKKKENKKIELEKNLQEWQKKEYIPAQLKIKDAFERFTRFVTGSKELTYLEKHKKKEYKREEDKDKLNLGKYSLTDMKVSPFGNLFTKQVAQEDTLSDFYKYIRGINKSSYRSKRKDDKIRSKQTDSFKDMFIRMKKSLGLISDNTKKEKKGKVEFKGEKKLGTRETSTTQKVVGGLSLLAGLGMMGSDFKEGGLSQAILGKSFNLYKMEEGKRKWSGDWKDIGMTALKDVAKYTAIGYGAGTMFGSPEMGALAGLITGGSISAIKFLWELLGPWVEDFVYWLREIFTWASGFGERTLAFFGETVHNLEIMADDFKLMLPFGGGLTVSQSKFKFKKGTYLAKTIEDKKISKGDEYEAYKSMQESLKEYYKIKTEFGKVKQEGVEKYGEKNLKDLTDRINDYMRYIQNTFEDDSDQTKEAVKLWREMVKLLQDQSDMAKHGSYQNRENILKDWMSYINKEEPSINRIMNP